MSSSLRTRFWRFALRKFFRLQKQTLAEHRAFAERGKQFIRVPKDVTIQVVNMDGIHAEWIIPKNILDDKVIVHLHGGGYVTGGIHSHKMMCILLAKTLGMKVLLPEYRLAPEHPFPAALEDCVKVYRWMLAHDHAASNIILSGDSAGGGLCIATGIQLRSEKAPLPFALICMSPWVDLSNRGRSHESNRSFEIVLTTETLKEWALHYTSEENLSDPLVSPVYADLHGLPPMLIQVSDNEILLDDSIMLAEKAKADGVDVTLNVWNDLWHAWQSLGDLIPESREAFEEIGSFIKKQSKREKIR